MGNPAEPKIKWTPYYRFWAWVHSTVNALAWRVYPKQEQRHRWLWKINDWAGHHYIDWWVQQSTGKTREDYANATKHHKEKVASKAKSRRG